MKHSFNISSLPYFEKWFIMGLIIGIISGLGALAFYFSIRFFEYLFLTKMVGINIPRPIGEGGSLVYVYHVRYFYLIPISVALGGAISGLIVYTFAPEAEGHGTDAAIRAFHYEQGRIRKRIPVVKTLASAVTIGSGGSAGREGPTAQISAGLGSLIADVLGLSDTDRRIAVAVGLGSGIGTIFKTPIGGTMLGAEILYRRDLETQAIYPSLVANAVGYSIFASVVGFVPIFGYYTGSFNVLRIPYYAILGVISGLFAIFYVRFFYFIVSLFKKMQIKNYFKPVIGGAVTGLLALAFPEILSTGYGWIDLLMFEKFQYFPTFGIPIILLLIALPFIKVISTSFTVGSGGSGGVFAPGMFIGASLGGALGLLFHYATPSLVPSITPFVIVGMISFFGAAGKVPLAVILMVVEMTGSLQLLPAAMIAVFISYIISGKYSIYKNQVEDRRSSPAHFGEFNTPILLGIKMSEVELLDIQINDNADISEAKNIMENYRIAALPVVNHKMFLGAVYLFDIANENDGKVNKFVRHGISSLRLNNNAEEAWELMMRNKTTWVAIVENGEFKGIVTLEAILKVYQEKVINAKNT
jgi:Chloride channel protein EriC